jgi:hypothetical protein
MELLSALLRARLGLMGALLVAASAALGQAGERADIPIKAAFLYKFGGFVEWPPEAFERPDSVLTIGVIGADALAGELESIVAERTMQGRRVAVRKLRRGESLAGLQVLFVGQSEGGKLGEILQGARRQPLLVVTESEDAFSQGSMINFVVEDKVRFDVALPPADRAQIRISARLLAVARKVITG